MTIALVHDSYDQKHLDEVKAEMVNLGAPVIKAVWMECFDMYAALEGCHRIRAAKELGLEPIIDEVAYSDNMASTISSYDGDEDYPISEICDYANRSTIIVF